MIASYGEIQTAGVRIEAAFDFTYTTPVDLCWIPILLIAGDYTTLAADALSHVEMESVLLAGSRKAIRNSGFHRIQNCASGAGSGRRIGCQQQRKCALRCSFQQGQHLRQLALQDW